MASETLEATLTRLTAGRNSWKDPCRACATSAITLSGEQTIDGVAIVSGDRVLVTAQASGAANGIYVCSTGAWRRAADLSLNVYARPGMTVRVISGTANSGLWGLTSPTTGAISLGSTSMTFEAVATAGASTDAAPFSELLTLSGNTIATYAGENGGVLVLGLLAGATHVPGSQHIVVCPAGAATTCEIGSDLDPSGDIALAFDPARNSVFVASCITADVVVLSLLDETDTTAAPTIVSATVDVGTNPNALVIVWSARVFLSALTGISLSFTSGTTRTITAIESGNGTATVTLTLSGNFDGSEVVDLVIGSGRVAQSLNKTLVTAETEAIVVNAGAYTMPGAVHEWITPVGSPVTSITDDIGADDLTAAGTIDAATVDGAAGADLNAAGAYLSVDPAAGETYTSGAIGFAFRLASGADQILFNCGDDGAEGTYRIAVFIGSGNLIGRRNGSTGADCTYAFSDTTADHVVLFTWSGTGAELWLDGVLVATDSTTYTVPAVGRHCVGALANLTSLPATDAKIGRPRIGNQHLTGADVTNFFAGA